MLQGLKLWHTCGSHLAETSYYVILAEVHMDYGDLSEADRLLKETLEKMDAWGERFYQPEFYRLQGKLLNFAGQAEKAKELFDKGIFLAQKTKLKDARGTSTKRS